MFTLTIRDKQKFLNLFFFTKKKYKKKIIMATFNSSVTSEEVGSPALSHNYGDNVLRILCDKI